tara:strand:- start:46 stop:597 length:552 start_codon:yes stop_codon:yes gene_type:complete
MIKILPITLIPLFFFIFYFNVIFLTDSNLPETENLKVDVQSEKTLIINENEPTTINEDQNQAQLNKSKDTDSDNISEKLEKTESKKEINDENLIKNKITKNQKENIKRIKVQFGAFKNDKNVSSLQSKLDKIFKKEFGDDFGSFLILKDKKHLKLILNTNSIVDAKKICNFSKKNNINCLIIY